ARPGAEPRGGLHRNAVAGGHRVRGACRRADVPAHRAAGRAGGGIAMPRESEERLESQAEQAQRATPGGAREEAVSAPSSWRAAYGQARDRLRGPPRAVRVLLGVRGCVVVALVAFNLSDLICSPG